MTNEHWVIIAGTRTFKDYPFLSEKVTEILDRYPRQNFPSEEIVIVSGGQKTIDLATNKYYGADYLGEKYSREVLGKEPVVYAAEWAKYGKRAGMLRNKIMAQNADGLIAFWDGKSPGTKNMIEEAKKRGLWVEVIEC